MTLFFDKLSDDGLLPIVYQRRSAFAPRNPAAAFCQHGQLLLMAIWRPEVLGSYLNPSTKLEGGSHGKPWRRIR
jgi:hypothetical protein